jgi:hypothetical protein
MAYTTINKSTDYFNTKLYTGNGSAGNAQTGVGFQPDFLWIKNRTASQEHWLADAVRGTTKFLESNSTNAESSDGATGLASFDSDGFTVNGSARTNQNSASMVAWNWKAGGTGSSNSDGDITSTVSANTTAGFSIVKWTSNGSDSDGIGHGLGVAPKIIIYKRTDGTGPWYWVYKYVDDTLDYLILNDTNAKSDLTLGTYGFSTSTTFTNLGFGNTHQLIAYCFAEKTGYSKFGSYVGNGNVDGTFVHTGFAPAFVMTKRTDSTSDWLICDNKRPGYNVINKKLFPNQTQAEDSYDSFDFVSNGFKIRSSGTGHNASGGTFIYMAFGQSLVGSNNVPCTAR